jgi:electron transfer flavoprotein beta subunit
VQKEETHTMNMIVCVKQVIDPEAPPASFKIDASSNSVVPPAGVPPVISPFDEQAVEAALRIKDAIGGTITAVSLGTGLLRDVVKKPLSMGADELVLLEDAAFDGGDSWSTANALAAAIKKIGEYDVVFCGRQAADWDAGQVGSGLAELLGLPSVTLAKKVEIMDGKAKVERVIPDGYEVVEVSLPALITVSNELGEPRYATIKGIMAAKRKEPVVWTPADIGVDASSIGTAGRRTKMLKLFQPVREGTCEIIEGEDEADAGANLATRLSEAKLL